MTWNGERSVRSIVRLANDGKKTWSARREKEREAPGTLSRAEAAGVTDGELLETFLDGVASKTDSEKWNRLLLVKWCKDPLTEERVACTSTHDINQWIERSLSHRSSRAKPDLSRWGRIRPNLNPAPRMPQFNVTVANLTGNAQVIHVFDTLTGGTRPVEGSPFSLASGGRSAPFGVNADPRGHGILAYRCQSGILLSGIDVTEGTSVEIR